MAESPDDAVRMWFVASDAQLGGAELYLGSLLERLGPRWVDGVLVLDDGPFLGWLDSAGIAPTLAACSGRKDLLRAASHLRRVIRARSTPLLHANGAKAAFVSVVAAAGTRTRVLWHRHDPTHDGWLGRQIARRCELVVAVSSPALGRLAYASGVHAHVVPNGVPEYSIDRQSARQTLLREVAAPAASRFVGLVGRLHPAKGQLELVEISRDVQAHVPELRVVLVGAADPHEPGYERLLQSRVAELGLEDVVRFLGYREDAANIAAGCDVLVVPSLRDPLSGWREGFSLAAVEAMSVGTPVVAYAEPALVEVLGCCAKLVRTGDRGGLTASVTELLENPDERARLADCGFARAGQFRLEDAVERMKAAYRVAARRASSAGHRDPALL